MYSLFCTESSTDSGYGWQFSVLLHLVSLSSDLISCEIKIGVVDSFPCAGVDMSLGNGITRSRVGVDSVVAVFLECSVSLGES